jgi:hypothetical protein
MTIEFLHPTGEGILLARSGVTTLAQATTTPVRYWT